MFSRTGFFWLSLFFCLVCFVFWTETRDADSDGVDDAIDTDDDNDGIPDIDDPDDDNDGIPDLGISWILIILSKLLCPLSLFRG